MDQRDLIQFKKEIAQLKTLRRNDSANTDSEDPGEKNEMANREYQPVSDDKKKIELFYFDPNTIAENQWKQLGLRDKTIHTIQHFLAKGGKFKAPEDLKRIYGLPGEDYNRLAPFVKIVHDHHVGEKADHEKLENGFVYNKKKSTTISPIEINTADSAELVSLPGIGSKLASRILHFRDGLGGFYSVNQVAEIYGLPDSTFFNIKPFLYVKPGAIRKIDINAADISTLKQHPYIRWELAKSIVAYRNQHGPFKKEEDLLLITIISRDSYQKISPYIYCPKKN